MFIWSLTYQQSAFKRYHGDKHFSVLPTRWRQKSTGIDMEQYYVIVTLCIGNQYFRSWRECKPGPWCQRTPLSRPFAISRCRFHGVKLRPFDLNCRRRWTCRRSAYSCRCAVTKTIVDFDYDDTGRNSRCLRVSIYSDFIINKSVFHRAHSSNPACCCCCCGIVCRGDIMGVNATGTLEGRRSSAEDASIEAP